MPWHLPCKAFSSSYCNQYLNNGCLYFTVTSLEIVCVCVCVCERGSYRERYMH